MENYIMINGKKIELTQDQVAQLYGDDTLDKTPARFNPAERKGDQRYYAANPTGVSDAGIDALGSVDDMLYGCANYWNDKTFAEHVALNMLLYRKLLQYAYNNDLVDDKPWDGATPHAFIAQYISGHFEPSYIWTTKSPCTVYFKSGVAAKMAIKNVVQPFIAEHPDFRVIW